MKRLLLSLTILFAGLQAGIVAQIATIQLEKTYPNNTRTCYFEIDNPPSEQQKAFVMTEAKNNKNLELLHFYKDANLVMFTSVAEWILDSVVDFINDALSRYPNNAYRIQSITPYTPMQANPISNYLRSTQQSSVDGILEMSNAPQRNNVPQRSFDLPPIYPSGGDPCLDIAVIPACGADSANMQRVIFSGNGTINNICGTPASPITSLGQEKIFAFTPTVSMQIKLAVTSISGSFNFMFLQSGDCETGQWDCKETISGMGIYNANVGMVSAGTTIYFMLDAVNTTESEITFYIQCANESICNFALPLECCIDDEQTVTLSGMGEWHTYSCAAASMGREVIYEFTPTTTGWHNLVVTSATGGVINYFYKEGACAPPIELDPGPPAIGNWNCIDESGISATGAYSMGYFNAGTTYMLLLDASNIGTRTHSFYIECPNENIDTGGGDCTTPIDQPNGCLSAIAFCTSSQYCFPASTNVPSMGSIGCLFTTPNAAWYWMKIDEPGDLTIHIEQRDANGIGRDVDFIAWGPFNTLADACTQKSMMTGLPNNTNPTEQYPYGNIVDCSYDARIWEICRIRNAQRNEIYLLLITNFSNQPANISFSKISGTSTSSCSIVAPQIENNGPLCVGDTLKLTAATSETMCAVYNWRGPNGFFSEQQNPIIPNVTLANGGRYTLTITAGGQTTNPEITHVVIGAPSDTVFINDTVCSNFLPYRRHGFNVSTAGEHKLHLKTNPHALTNPNYANCDSIVVLNLVINPTTSSERFDTICPGDSVLFVDGRYYKTTGTFTATIPNSNFCDSVVKLHLYVIPTLTINRSASICEGESYPFYGQNLTLAGVYQHTFGCDSIVILTLSVGDVNTKTINANICFGTSYDFYGRELTDEGVYTHRVIMDGSCDTLVTLNLTVRECSDMKIISIDEICADHENINVHFDVTEGELSCYSVNFNSQAIGAGFTNIVCEPLLPNERQLEIPIPQFPHPNYVRPEYYTYSMEIVFYFTDGTHRTFNENLNVLYPSWIIEQKWNDVLALLNEAHNGGYIWSGYEWYKGSEEIKDDRYRGSYIYGQLDFSAQYRAMLRRVGENVSILTCAVTPKNRTDVLEIPSLVARGEIMGIKAKESGVVTIYSVSGIIISKQNLLAGENFIQMPAQQGFYIMVVEEKNQVPIKQVLVVK